MWPWRVNFMWKHQLGQNTKIWIKMKASLDLIK